MSNIQGIQKIPVLHEDDFQTLDIIAGMALVMTGEAGSAASEMKCFHLPSCFLLFLLSSLVFTFLCLPSTFYTKSLFSCLEFGML